VASDSKRLLLAVIVSVAVMTIWSEVFGPKGPPPGAPVAPDGGAPAAAAPTPTPSAPGAPATTVPPGPVAPSAPEEEAVLETEDFRAVFSSWGGTLKSLVLKSEKYQRRREGKDTPVDLVLKAADQPGTLALVPSKELGGTGDPGSDPLAMAPMRIASKDSRSVVFEGTLGGLSVTKTFSLGEKAKKYELNLSVTTSSPAGGVLGILTPGMVPPGEKQPTFFNPAPAVVVALPLCRAGEDTHRLRDNPGSERYENAQWTGLDQHYFVTAVIPAGQVRGSCEIRGLGEGKVLSTFWLPVGSSGQKAAGVEQVAVDFKIYMGPKQVDLLQSYGGTELDTAVDYGWFTSFFKLFAQALLKVMRFFEKYTQSWGIAIILLTVLVKTVLYPLTKKTLQSALAMRRLQPEIEKLKAKHGNDREKFGQAQMQLFMQHKVNPLGGCLPMLVQMPIWFALYATLQTSVELYRERFLWVADLTAHDPIYVLPVLMGISSFFMQRLAPQPADKAQAKMLLYFMPIFFTFIMLNLPAGLTLYIVVNNILSIAQQQWFYWRHEPERIPVRA
jgi:YidC/Oxa1 family membrane protein insertase